MVNYEWIERNNKKIFYMNIASKTPEELDGKIKEFKEIITKEPEQSMLTITDTTDGAFSRTMSKALSEFAQHNKPYIKMSVIIGLDGLKKILYDGTLRLTGRKNMIIKNSKEEAINYLSSID